MEPLALLALLAACAPLVDPSTARALIQVESAFNPHAIGVVGGRLERQPRNRGEALATTRSLQREGLDFSVGLVQINVRNLPRLGLTLEQAFEPCANLRAMETILCECLDRVAPKTPEPQAALRHALSCYYSGDFTTGFRDGYVRRVVRAIPVSPSLRAKETP